MSEQALSAEVRGQSRERVCKGDEVPIEDEGDSLIRETSPADDRPDKLCGLGAVHQSPMRVENNS